ncbi:hypothetical protein MKW94_021604 [Papaver nudicaule]|uniref:NADH-ubiquinone oxidoreductase chain 4 n=1 Tax=Papaver nudicaule TaxID=74823 RepID=A0AA41VYT6_PAPNU|nr:hypothetical protein [Papaver nudicaule]
MVLSGIIHSISVIVHGLSGGHLPKSAFPRSKRLRVQAEKTCIDSGLMTRADDRSSGRSRMMRKSHVRFPEKGVATYWSFDQPHHRSIPGASPYSTIIIGVWGSRQRKIKAAYQFFLYTSLGSVFMLLAIPLILLQTGTTDLQISLTTEFSERRQIFLWIASFASFAVKVPMVPVHIWSPEAHVEAPTAGSVILAGILLKLGTYGFLRFSIPMFPEATLRSTPFIYTPSAIAIIYTSSTTSRQIDLKKIIAYSPVAHMNLVTIGMFSPNIQGIGGSIPPMSSHGPVPPALFLCVGVLYDRHKTRLVRYYGGSVSTMPNLSTIFFSSTLANMSSPGTSSFIGEFPILVGAFQRNSLVATLAALGMILGAAYSLWLYNRAVSGNLKPDFLHKFSDPNGREVSIFIPFLVGVVRMGVHPKVFSDRMHTSVSNLVQHGKFN